MPATLPELLLQAAVLGAVLFTVVYVAEDAGEAARYTGPFLVMWLVVGLVLLRSNRDA